MNAAMASAVTTATATPMISSRRGDQSTRLADGEPGRSMAALPEAGLVAAAPAGRVDAAYEGPGALVASASARANSAHLGNRSAGLFASAHAKTPLTAPSSGRAAETEGGSALRWRLM